MNYGKDYDDKQEEKEIEHDRKFIVFGTGVSFESNLRLSIIYPVKAKDKESAKEKFKKYIKLNHSEVGNMHVIASSMGDIESAF